MSRRMRWSVCMLILVLLVQTACVPSGQTEQTGRPEPVPSVTAAPEPTPPEPTPPETATPEPTPVETQPVLPPPEQPKASILDNRQAVDEDGVLWYIPNERVEQGLMQTVLRFGENLLLYGSGRDEEGNYAQLMALLSSETGELLHETALTGIDLPGVQVCGNLVAVTDWSDGEVYLMDETLTTVREYCPEGISYGGTYVSPDGSTVYFVTRDEGVRAVALESGDTWTLLEEAANLLSAGQCGDGVSLTYTDRETQFSAYAVLDLTTGTVEKIPFEGGFYNAERSGEVWLASAVGLEESYYLGTAEQVMTFRPEGYSLPSLLDAPTRVLSTAYDTEGNFTMLLYDADGTFRSRCCLDPTWNYMYADPVWLEEDNGYLFTVIDETGKDILLFWDLSAEVSGENLQMEPVEEDVVEPGTMVSQVLYKKAQALSETYGMEVLIAEQCREEFNDFTAERELNEQYIFSALDTLQAVLRSYPEGMTQQLLYGHQRKIEIHLVGALYKRNLPEEVSGFSVFDGFVSTEGGQTVLVVNIRNTWSLKQTLYHEMMHLIDHKLAFDAGVREDAVYSEEEWGALNPKDFAYPETYDRLPGEIYTDGYEGWFVDIYSRTFAKEDRARIMEYAMTESDWMFTYFPGRMGKLEYLCACIRDCFDTTGWPERTVWEETLYQAKYNRAVG